MKKDQINITGYNLIKNIIVTPLKREINKIPTSIENIQFVDWSEKHITKPSFERTLNPDFSSNIITLRINDNKYSLEESHYEEFYRLIDQIQTIEFYSTFVSFEFLEEKTLFWIVDLFINSKSSNDLLDYLKIEAEKSIKKHTFYFHIINLCIDNSFKIGNVELFRFTKEYFDKYWESFEFKNEVSKDDFDNLYRKYQDRVFASYEVKAEFRKGKEIAFKECGLAIDVLKLFSPTLVEPNRKCYIDLADRINVNFQSETLVNSGDNKYSFIKLSSAKNDPFFLNIKVYQHIVDLGLNIFSEHIKKQEENELSTLITQSISLFSYAISTFNLHFRVTQMITIFESLFLEEDRKYKMEEYVTKRVGYLFYLNSLSENEKQKNMLSGFYKIRHKMIHKAIKLPIDINQMMNFQITLHETLIKLCDLNSKIKDKESLLHYLSESK